jgi:hypothetical protein
VLCYLENMTNAEAAEQLGCPLNTLKSRLARARDRLRVRLARRGLVFSAGGFAAVLVRNTGAAVPAALVDSLGLVGAAWAAGHLPGPDLVSPSVITLAKGVSKAMTLPNLKVFISFALAIALVGGGTMIMLAQTGAEKTSSREADGAKGAHNAESAIGDDTPVPAKSGDDTGKSVDLGPLDEFFSLVRVEHVTDPFRGKTLILILEAKKDVDTSALFYKVGFYSEGKELRLASDLLFDAAFPLEKGERVRASASSGREDVQWKKIAIRRAEKKTN